MKRFFIVLLILATSSFYHIEPHGFFASTQVLTPDGKTETIHTLFRSALKAKKKVKSFNVAPATCCDRRIKEVARGTTNCYVRLGFEDDQPHQYISCTPTQEFYLPCERRWLPAYCIKPGTKLLGKCHRHVALKHIELVKRSLEIYSLEVEGTHNFRVGRHAVLTHNMVIPSAALGFSLAFDSAALFSAWTSGASLLSAFGPLGLAAAVGLGSGLGILISKMRAQEDPHFYKLNFKPNLFDNVISKNVINAFNEQNAFRLPETQDIEIALIPDTGSILCAKRNNRTSPNNGKGGGNGNGKDNGQSGGKGGKGVPEEGDQQKHPNGRYHDAPYRHGNSKGPKSPAPIDGQGALDASLPVIAGEAARRVAIEGDKVVVLSRTSDGLYHGYVCEWGMLSPELQNACKRYGLVNPRGKIVR